MNTLSHDSAERQIEDVKLLRDYAADARNREDHVGASILEHLAGSYESGDAYFTPVTRRRQ